MTKLTVGDPIFLANDTISQSELQDLADWIVTNPRLTKGPTTEAFERVFAEQVGSKHGVFVNSGSSANLLAVAAALHSGRLRNNRALAPGVSWVTTVTPFMHLGFDVRLVDADSKNLGLDPISLEKQIVDFDPSVLILVHVLGHANHMKEIVALCKKYDVFLIEDTCEALGTSGHDGRWLGTIGNIGTFSFYYGHHISTIEGGMAVTDDPELYELMLSLRSHGWSRDLSEATRKSLQGAHGIGDFANLYTFYNEGFNLRPTDLQAKLGLSQMGKLEEIRTVRQANFQMYSQLLPDFWRQSSETALLSSFAYGTFVENRDEVGAALARVGIESRPLLCGNIGRHPFWMKKKPEFRGNMADFVHSAGIYFPNHAGLDNEQIIRICDVVRQTGVPAFPDS